MTFRDLLDQYGKAQFEAGRLAAEIDYRVRMMGIINATEGGRAGDAEPYERPLPPASPPDAGDKPPRRKQFRGEAKAARPFDPSRWPQLGTAQFRLLEILADGREHNVDELARVLEKNVKNVYSVAKQSERASRIQKVAPKTWALTPAALAFARRLEGSGNGGRS